MKRIWTAFLAVLLFSSLAFTLTSQTGRGANQYTILWTNIYGAPANQTCYSLAQTSDGGYVLEGTNNSVIGAPGIPFPQELILKTDSAGNLLWIKDYDILNYRGGWGYGIVQTLDNGLVFGYNTLGAGMTYFTSVFKTDSNGNRLWSKNNIDYYGSVLMQSNDGGLIFGGYSGYYVPSWPLWLNKTDSSGNQIWGKTYTNYNSSTLGSTLYGMAQANDGGYALFGRYIGLDALLIKVDSNGNELWHKIYTIFSSFGEAIITNDGGFLVSNGPGLVKLDSSGNIQWNQTYGTAPSAFTQTDDNGYLVVGGNTLFKVDSSGNVQWSQPFTSVSLSGITRTNDGNYAIAGTYSGGINTYSWLAKISLPSPTPTPSPTATPSPSPSPTPTASPTPTPTPTPTANPTPSPSPSPSPTPTTTTQPTSTPTTSPTSIVTPTPTPTSTSTSTPTPTAKPTLSPTATQNPATSSPSPSQIPSPSPTPLPQVTETPLYLYALAVTVIAAISATTALIIKKRR